MRFSHVHELKKWESPQLLLLLLFFSACATTEPSLLKALAAGNRFQVGSFSRWKPEEILAQILSGGFIVFHQPCEEQQRFLKVCVMKPADSQRKAARRCLSLLVQELSLLSLCRRHRRCRCFSELQLRWDRRTGTAGTCLGFVWFVLNSQRTSPTCSVLSAVKNTNKRNAGKKSVLKGCHCNGSWRMLILLRWLIGVTVFLNVLSTNVKMLLLKSKYFLIHLKTETLQFSCCFYPIKSCMLSYLLYSVQFYFFHFQVDAKLFGSI